GSQHFSIVSNTGYHVDSLIIDGVKITSDTQYTFSGVVSTHTIRATFAINTYTINSSAGANGTISPTPSTTVNYGGSQHFSIIPNTGYHVDSLIIDGVNITSDTQYTFSGIVSNHTIRATFAPNAYTITSSAGENGTIFPTPSIFVSLGGSQHFSITPNMGYHVDSLIVDGVKITTDTQYTFSGVISNHTIRATFAINTYSITSSAGAHGTISPTPSAIVNYGGNQHFSIMPNSGYHVDSLIVDGVKITSDTQYTFTGVVSDHSIRATFASDAFTITSSAGSNGTISPTPTATVNYGGSQHFSVTPNTGYHVDSLIIDGIKIASDTQYTFSGVASNHTIRATFTINTFVIKVNAGLHGTVSPPDSVIINYATDTTFTITPDLGYHISDVLVDGFSRGPISSFRFTSVTSNHSISAVFAIDIFTINAATIDSGTISPAGISTLNYGDSLRYTITSKTGYHIADVLVDNHSLGAISSYLFTNVTANHTITAIFSNKYLIVAGSDTNGTISPKDSVYAIQGTDQNFIVSPKTGYHIFDVSVDLVSQGNISSYTFVDVQTNHTIFARFAIDTFTILSTYGTHGAIKDSGIVRVTYGSNKTFTLLPENGYHTVNLLVDSVALPGSLPSSYQFTNIVKNHTIHADFDINKYTIIAKAGLHGTISPVDTVTLNYGSNQTYTITPNTGYHIDSVIVDGTNQGRTATFAFTSVIANHTIRAAFAVNTYTIRADSVSGAGVIHKSPDQPFYSYGSIVTLTAFPDTGWQFDHWAGDTTSTDSILSLTVVQDRFVYAIFKVQPLYLTSFRTGSYESWSTAKDQKDAFNAIKRVNDKIDFKFTLEVSFQSDGKNLTLVFSGPSTGYLYLRGTTIALDSFQNVKTKIFTFNPALNPGTDAIDVIGRFSKGKGLLIKYAWGKNKQNIVNVWGVGYPKPGLPMPNLHNVGEELFPVGARGGVVPVFTHGLLVGLADSKNSVLMPTYNDVKKSLLAGRGGYHATGDACLSFRRQARNYPPTTTQNNMFANALVLKMNIAASIEGKTPNGFGELTYSDPDNPSDPLNGRQVSAISLIADTALSCGSLKSATVTNAQINAVLKKLNNAFDSIVIDTTSFGVQTIMTGTRPLVDCKYLKRTIGAIPMNLSYSTEYYIPLPNEFRLYQNFPNPFNPTTTIEFNLPYSSIVTLKIYNILGQEVASLLNHEQMDNGTQTLDFDGSNIASGVYFYRLIAQGQDDEGNPVQFVKSNKMVLIK
ncbi:MAG: T9SS type A sorting domain-containing protein, partial [Bacteroidota bacterium]